ncbi:Xaa-Pro aminopeptidase OS=Ureibacillus acetophenoni OX=614649 GN=SAMN05877842_102136 PE=4 SV=1 [Ureibacillus acetophenoni]
MNFQKRREILINSLQINGIDNFLIQDLDNIYYLTGFNAAVTSRPFGFVFGHKHSVLIVPATAAESAKQEAQGVDIAIYYEHPTGKDENLSFHDSLTQVVGEISQGKIIGVEANKLSIADLDKLSGSGIEIQDISNAIMQLRSIKEEEEIEAIRISAKYVDFIIESTLGVTRPGITEIELDQEGAFKLRNEVAKNLPQANVGAFIMTTSGTDRTILPHTNSSLRQVEYGDSLLFCRQVAINGYRAQCDRTIFVGHPSKEMEYYYSLVLEAHAVALKTIQSGITASEVDQAIRGIFRNAGVEQYFVHRSGSGLGISMGEAPYLRFDSQEILAENMVLVIQPAIYVPGIGGFRCSDTVIVREDGCELITHHPRDIQSLTV